ncbi:uncharacterized protein LOC141859379 [Acropora palmata]|uniref:uncharacterized protein LOC141859379 n=1 Tax=Acropora palmata TaxID=6131 RepID=UPI003DA0D809
MAAVLVDRPNELNHLFGDISCKFSAVEAAEVVKSSKRIYGQQFESLQNEDLLSCLKRLLKFGYVSSGKLTLIRDYVASKSNNKDEIKKTIDNYIQVNPLQVESEKQMQGRDNDITKITGRLKDGRSSIVNLHGSGGVGKTTLAKEICVKWQVESHIFDLREAKDMRAVCLKVMNTLDLPVHIDIDSSSVVEKVFEQAFMKAKGLPVLFLLDNADQFTLGQGKEGKNLKTAFMQFLGKLTRYDEKRKTRELRILLTSRTSVKEASKVEDYELLPLKDTFSEKILLSNKNADINAEQLKKFSLACNGKPLLLLGLRAILEQGRKIPSDLLNELEKYMQSHKEKGDEDAKEKTFDLEDEGVGSGEKSVMHEMFNTLPSDSLKESAVSISLFCGPFSTATAAVILGISLPEAVAQLEGLETSAIISVQNREAKELMYDIHPLLKKYAESIKNDEQFVKSYSKARKRFYDHFMSRMKMIGGFVDANFVEAFNMFTSDDANYKFAIEISLEPEFFSVPGEYHENNLIVSLINAMLSSRKRRELFNSWASLCRVDTETGSLFHAHLKCWEAMHVLDHDGPKEALGVLQEAAQSLEKVQEKTATSFRLTQGLYSCTEGEIYYKTQDYKKALQSLKLCLHYMEELPEVNLQLARCYNAMGNCYYHGLEDYTKAQEFYSKAIKVTEKISGTSKYHYDLPVYKNQIGTVYEGQGDYAKAIEYYKEAITLLEELKISGCPDEANFQRNLANAYLYQDSFKEAVKPAERAFEIRKKHLGDHPDTVRSIFQRGVIQAFLEEPKKALDLFKKAWDMEKLLQPGNHSVVWKQIIEHIVYFIKDGNQKKKFEEEALAFCQRMWKEEKEISTFSFNKSTKEIIDTLMGFLREGKRDESTIYEYEKEELWFYDGFQSSTEQDFCGEFDAETDNGELNKMICDRIELINKILDLCNRLDQHEMRIKYQRIKLTIYRKGLFKRNFVGEKENEKETVKKAVEQLYTELGEKERIAEFLESLLSSWIVHWEQRGGGADESEMSSLAKERTIRGILQLCKDLNKENQYHRFGKEALIFFEDLWGEKAEEMDARMTRKFLREIKDLASSVRDHDRERHYQDVYQTFLNTEEKPGTLRDQESEVEKEDEEKVGQSVSEEEEIEIGLEDETVEQLEEEKEGQTVSEEEEIEITLEDETVEQLEEEEEGVVLTSEGESEMASEDENEFLGDFSNTNLESIVLHRGKAATHCFLKQVGIHLMFPPGIVSEGRVSSVQRWNPRFRSPPLFDIEAVVSDVIELSLDSPGGLDLDKSVTLVIPHSASDLKGYEVVIKCFSSGDEWKDVETADWRTKSDIKGDYDLLSAYAPDFSFPVAACKISQCSTVAVVCRLKSRRHVVTCQESELVWPEFPLAKVSFPQNAVPQEESLEVTAKLQEVSQRQFRQMQILAGAILRITSSKAVDFLKPVTVQLPLSLSEPQRKDIDMSVARVRILFKESSLEKQEWIEITDKLETLPRFNGNTISFTISHFSDFWTWVDWCSSVIPLCGHSNPDSDKALESVITNSDLVPKAAFFAVYVPRKTKLHLETKLRLYCSPTSKRGELIDYEEKQQNVLIGDGSSDEQMCSNDKAFVFLSEFEGIVKPVEPEGFEGLYVRLQDDVFLQNVDVCVQNRGKVTVSFYKTKERDEGNRLCKMNVKLPPSTKDPDKTPVEFFGLPFDDEIFRDADCDGPHGILTSCNGVLRDICRERIYDDYMDLLSKRPEREVKEKFLMEISKLHPQYKQRCFDSIVSALEEGGKGMEHIRDRLIEAQEKIDKPINDQVWDAVADRFQYGTPWKTLAGDLQPKIKDCVIDAIEVEKGGCSKECCRAVLKTWYQRHTSGATNKELMRCLTNMGLAKVNWQIMRELGLVELENIPESER